VVVLTTPKVISAQTPSQTATFPFDWKAAEAQNYWGYTRDEVEKLFAQPVREPEDRSGLDASRVSPPPKSGVHPRVLLHPEDLPDLRRRLKETIPGRMAMDSLRAALAKGIQRHEAVWSVLCQGRTPPDAKIGDLAHLVTHEMLRCLIDEDAEGGRKAAAVVTEVAKALQTELREHKAKLAAKKPGSERDFQSLSYTLRWGMIGLAYDFGYQWMDDSQRGIVRAFLAESSQDMTQIGCDAPPALPANTSNWIGFHLRQVHQTLAIEGEPGFDPATAARLRGALERLYTVNVTERGELYEGMGKNWLMPENALPYQRRGVPLLTLAKVRNQVRDYYLHSLSPWSKGWTFYDSNGGSNCTPHLTDVLLMKHLYPQDPKVDYIYRCTVGEDYKAFKVVIRGDHPMNVFSAIPHVLFASEYLPGRTLEQAREAATAGVHPVYFNNDTGNLIAHSSWNPDALQMMVLTRSLPGGHRFPDRGHLELKALGRSWSVYRNTWQKDPDNYRPIHRSLMTVDGRGPSNLSGRCVDMQDDGKLTSITVDTTLAYNWRAGGTERTEVSLNAFRLKPSPLPWMALPLSDLPNWQTGKKGQEFWTRLTPSVRYSRRTAALIKGNRPWVLVADDMRHEDDETRLFRWHLALDKDLSVGDLIEDKSGKGFRRDLIVAEDAPGAPPRRMLVRVLSANGMIPPKENPPSETKGRSLEIYARAVDPAFRLLIFPYRDGDSLPETRWIDAQTLSVRWPDGEQTVRFVPDGEGGTRFVLESGPGSQAANSFSSRKSPTYE
jgi:hypothetical protein